MAGAIRGRAPVGHREDRGGAEGSASTRRELERLGWHAVHDVENARGSYDVVAGACGVYLLETRKPAGTVEIREEVPWLCRRDGRQASQMVDVRRQVMGASAMLRSELRRLGVPAAPIHAVVVLWCEFPQGVASAGKVTFVHGSRLRVWLGSQPARLDSAELARAVGALAALGLQSDARRRR